MAETTDLTTETDKIEETLDGAQVIGPYRAQLLEYNPPTQEDEEFIELDTRSNDWSDVPLAKWETISKDEPADVAYEGGGIAGACIDPATGDTVYASSDPGTGATSVVPVATTVKGQTTPSTSTKPSGAIPNVQATTSAPSNINELQKEIVNQATEWLQKRPPGDKWENGEANVAIGESLIELRKKFPDRSGMGNQMWCALFTTVCVNEACKVVGAKNTCPIVLGAAAAVTGKTPPTDSGPPEVGDIVFFPGKRPTGHVGIVVSVASNSFLTIEGNSGDAVAMRKYKWPYTKTLKFKHAGRMPHTGKARNINGYGKLSGLASAGYLKSGNWTTT